MLGNLLKEFGTKLLLETPVMGSSTPTMELNRLTLGCSAWKGTTAIYKLGALWELKAGGDGGSPHQKESLRSSSFCELLDIDARCHKSVAAQGLGCGGYSLNVC